MRRTFVWLMGAPAAGRPRRVALSAHKIQRLATCSSRWRPATRSSRAAGVPLAYSTGWHVERSWHSLGAAAAVARITCDPGNPKPAIEAAACHIPASLYLCLSRSARCFAIPIRRTPVLLLPDGRQLRASRTSRFRARAAEEARARVCAPIPRRVGAPGEWTILGGYLIRTARASTHYGVEACCACARSSFPR